MDFINTPAYYSWCGFAFERVCLLHIRQIKNALRVLGVTSQEYAWRSKKSKPQVQIDLLIDRKDDVINLCEIKYTEGLFAIDATYEQELIHKISVFRNESDTSKAILLTMITYGGLQNNAHKNIVMNELTSADLFREI